MTNRPANDNLLQGSIVDLLKMAAVVFRGLTSTMGNLNETLKSWLSTKEVP